MAKQSVWAGGAAVAVLLLASSWAASAAETMSCDQRQKVIGHLATKYQEAPVAVGVTSTGRLVEVLSTDDGQTWTIILSHPDGTSCLLAAGEGWRKLDFDVSAADPQV